MWYQTICWLNSNCSKARWFYICHSVCNQSFTNDTATSVISSWSDICHDLDHADMHLWHEDLDDTKQSETKWWQDRCSHHEVKQNHFCWGSANFSLCWYCRHSIHDVLTALVSWFEIIWLLTSKFQLPVILHKLCGNQMHQLYLPVPDC